MNARIKIEATDLQPTDFRFFVGVIRHETLLVFEGLLKLRFKLGLKAREKSLPWANIRLTAAKSKLPMQKKKPS